MYKAECLYLQNRLVWGDSEGLTDPPDRAGVNAERDLPACMDGTLVLLSLPHRSCRGAA